MNDALKGLLKKVTGDELIANRLQVSSEAVATPADLWGAVRSFASEQGWLCLTDRVVSFYKATELAGVEGIILSGELVNGGKSLHIRQAESGWQLTRLESGIGDDCLMCRETYIGTDHGQQDRLHYEVYWKMEDGSYRPYTGRFAGLQEGGAQ